MASSGFGGAPTTKRSDARATEYRVEKDSGWLLSHETHDLTPWDGIRIRWRFVGERLWRKKVIIPDADLGQTQASLKADADLIVEALARAVEPQASTATKEGSR